MAAVMSGYGGFFKDGSLASGSSGGTFFPYSYQDMSLPPFTATTTTANNGTWTVISTNPSDPKEKLFNKLLDAILVSYRQRWLFGWEKQAL